MTEGKHFSIPFDPKKGVEVEKCKGARAGDNIIYGRRVVSPLESLAELFGEWILHDDPTPDHRELGTISGIYRSPVLGSALLTRLFGEKYLLMAGKDKRAVLASRVVRMKRFPSLRGEGPIPHQEIGAPSFTV